MKKKLLAIALILSLFSVSALAAPTRQIQGPLGLSEAELMAVQPLLNAAATAAFQQQIERFPNGSAPSQALAEGMLLRAISEGLFPLDTKGDSLFLSPEEARDMAAKLFTSKELPALNSPGGPQITQVESGLQINLASQPDFIGAYVYAGGDSGGEGTLLQADIYRLSGIEGRAEDVPEDSIQWIGHMGLRLEKSDNTPAGYTLSSFAVNEHYAATGFHQLYDEVNGYELSYPDIFPLREAPLQKHEPLQLGSADARASLTVSFAQGSLSELETLWQKDKGVGNVWMTEHGALTLQNPTEKRLALPDEEGGQCLVLTLIQPDDKPYEYGLYWEFLVNSFVVYAHASG